MSTSGGSAGGGSPTVFNGAVAADVTVPAISPTTWITTASLDKGKWLITVTMAYTNTSTTADNVGVYAQGGTATYTVSGVAWLGAPVAQSGSATLCGQVLVDVSVAGTVELQASCDQGGKVTYYPPGFGGVAGPSSGYTALAVS